MSCVAKAVTECRRLSCPFWFLPSHATVRSTAGFRPKRQGTDLTTRSIDGAEIDRRASSPGRDRVVDQRRPLKRVRCTWRQDGPSEVRPPFGESRNANSDRSGTDQLASLIPRRDGSARRAGIQAGLTPTARPVGQLTRGSHRRLRHYVSQLPHVPTRVESIRPHGAPRVRTSLSRGVPLQSKRWQVVPGCTSIGPTASAPSMGGGIEARPRGPCGISSNPLDAPVVSC